MSTNQEFKCIFCNDTFENKEELQVHFRKHGDPNFGQTKVKNEASSSSDKKEDGEMVSCDVCSEVFPTIAKAITHKHKLHPDHDAKYFCPWCGKLFTLKYLLHKHLGTNHIEDKRDITIDNFPCHSCNVEFYVPSAMLYHNKFFHRQDTELPAIGYSRKLKKVKQDLLMIYYCPFCGEEYDNKINLHKHMVDDHFDENQHPEDVLRCPLCEAIFYHLDAYELHLTFHSEDDLYSEKNEIVSQITEFSLEAVPPLMEKVENDVPDEVNNDDINQLLSLAMDDMAADSDPDRVRKKRKKHKKSKKSAITLDEFLDMNADVFGGNLDVHGIEEVPTRVINKSLKAKRKVPAMSPGSKITSADIAKLKQQGIVVKMKSNKGPGQNKQILQKVRVGPGTKLPSTSAVKKTPVPDCKQVLEKLMNQSNSQIKIVKKPIQSTQVESSGTNIQFGDNSSKTSEFENDYSKTKSTTSDNQGMEQDDAGLNETLTDNTNLDEKKTSKIDTPTDPLRAIDKNVTIKPVQTHPCVEKNTDFDQSIGDIGLDEDNNKSDHSNLDAGDHRNITEEYDSNLDVNAPLISEQALFEENEPLSVLKNLSKNITIKPSCPTKLCKAPEKKLSEELEEDLEKVVSSTSQNTTLASELKSSSINEENALKKLSDTISIKPCKQVSKNIVDDDKSLSDDSDENGENKQQVPTPTNFGKGKIVDDLSGEQLPVQSTNTSKCNDGKEQEDDNFTDSENEDAPSTELGKLTEFPSHLSTLKKLGSHITFTSNKQNVEAKDKEITDEGLKAEAPGHLDVLKKLGSGIILKSNKPQASTHESDKYSEKSKESINIQTKAESPAHLQALKKLGSNITFKSNKQETASSNVTNRQLDEHKKNVGNLQKPSIESLSQQPNLKKIINKETVKLSPNANNKMVPYTKTNTNTGHNFKNTSTKSITTKNVSQETNCNMVGKIIQNKCTKSEYSETEIFSIDDSDDEDLNTMSTKMAATNKALKQDSKNVIINNPPKKNFVGPARFKNLGKKIEDNITNAINKANTSLENSLKKLSQHITIKSNKPDTGDDFNTADPESDWGQDSDSNDSTQGIVKISEVTEAGKDFSDNDNDFPETKSPLVDSPDQSDNENAPHSEEEACDIESQLKASTVKKSTPPPVNKNINEFKNLGKDICIKPIKRDQSPSTSTKIHENPQTLQLNKVSNSNQGNTKINRCASQTKVAQKSSASNQVNTVSKEVTVKTYQTETVIEEVTTTVTKTIRTVNQMMKQENSSETVQHTTQNRMQSNNSLVGVQPKTIKARGRPPVNKNTVPNQPQQNTKITIPSTSNQLVPVRPARPANPKMPPTKKTTPSPNQQGTTITKPLKIAPNVDLRPTIKRPGPKQNTSMSKKFKESSVTSTEVSTTSDKGGSMKQFSASQSESCFTSTTQLSKGSAGMSQMKTQSHTSCSQQLSKLSNISGMKITKAVHSQQSSSMEVKNDVTSSVANRSTLDAIEKLQKQGLLVKKPRVEEENVQSDFSDYET